MKARSSRPWGAWAAANTGSSLVEVAVSLLVICVGTLGLAGLQIAGKRMGYEAVQRSDAAALAQDLLERMRANRGVLSHYATDGIGAASGSALHAPREDCARVSCSAVQLNAWDMWQWERSLNGAASGGSAGGLVNAMGCVSINGRQVAVDIAWEGFREQPDPHADTGCGAGKYGIGDVRRQRLRMTSFIAAE